MHLTRGKRHEGSSTRFDPSRQNLDDGYYPFNWSTPKGYANSCKTMQLNLGDGLTGAAYLHSAGKPTAAASTAAAQARACDATPWTTRRSCPRAGKPSLEAGAAGAPRPRHAQ